MRFRLTLTGVTILTLLCVLAFAYVLRQVSVISVGLAAHDEVERELRRSLDDQKKLARLDPASAGRYHQRFDNTRELIGYLHVLALSRETIRRRVELTLGVMVACVLTGAAAIFLMERRRIHARQQQRIRYLEHLAAWQEAARRHAHEIRTPLTSAQMEVERLARAATSNAPAEEIAEARSSVLTELARLNEFTKSFTSFATVSKPRLHAVDLGKAIADYCQTFAAVWPDLKLTCVARNGEVIASVDREMLRQVLVNLCNNSALAGAHAVLFRISKNATSAIVDVSDDGPGVAPDLRDRLFEPYVTTRPIGKGMGLGLAISKKILLDHGGDLELLHSSTGATFRLTLARETSQ